MPVVRIVEVKPFRNQHKVVAEIKMTVGMWWWKRDHTQEMKLITQDGVQYHYAPGESRQGRRVAPELEDALYRAMEMFQQSNSDEQAQEEASN